MNVNVDSSTISLRRMRFHARHGVLPQERVVGNDYEVTVRMTADVSRAVETDDVADTLNYAEAYETISEQMAVPSQLLEHVAGRMAKALFRRFGMLSAVEVCITKLCPPIGADCDGAEVCVCATREPHALTSPCDVK